MNERKKKGLGGRRLKADPAMHKYTIRLNSTENGRFELLDSKSGLATYTQFIKAQLFGTPIKVVKIDKTTRDYYIRLTNFYHQFQAIGNNYNQTVRAIKSNFSEKRAFVMLQKLESATLDLVRIGKQITDLTREYERNYLCRPDETFFP